MTNGHFGLDRASAERVLNKLWNDPERPPWDVRASRIEHQKVAFLEPWLAGRRRVLDAGCGGGDFLDLVVNRTGAKFEHVVGADVADGALVRARKTGRYAELVQSHLEDLPGKIAGERFDLVLLSDVLSHVADYVRALAALVPLVDEGGVFFVSLGMGKKYFVDRDLLAIRSFVGTAGLRVVAEAELDYEVLGLPRRLVPLHDTLWPQTHKRLLLFRREPKTAG
jgi:2-polyprenyl-3-methyl-5-hydroxy-6-metoxy-1,4-benzoquinol methylase